MTTARLPSAQSLAAVVRRHGRTSSHAASRGGASIPASTVASNTLGVITSASGNNSCLSTCRPSSFSRVTPDDDRSTGSTTMLSNLKAFRKVATVEATATDPSIPTRTAAMSRSSASAPKVRSTKSASTDRTSNTPWLDWTVKAVTQVTAKQPWAAAVLMSAVTPAPEEGSYPAMLSTTGGTFMELNVPQNLFLGILGR